METLTTAVKAAEQLVGEWREPRNRWQGAENSIHTDAVAKSIGMRGGTIPGVVHLGHFRPILTQLFGERWLSRGSISMYYTYATLDGEKVRAIVEPPAGGATDNVQMAAWVEDAEGKTVCKGTVSVGDPDAVPYVRGLPLENAPAGANRILRAMTPGVEIPAREDFRITDGADADGVVREPHYMFRALQVFPPEVDTKPAVGFYGATEIRLVNGPIRADTLYRKTGRVAAVCDSPKTEFAWFDSELTDADGRLVAEMRHMTRWMKVSSPLWKA
jgi:hypothetical protein